MDVWVCPKIEKRRNTATPTTRFRAQREKKELEILTAIQQNSKHRLFQYFQFITKNKQKNKMEKRRKRNRIPVTLS
ncbi:hypothetical protein [Methanimicrococcus hongohii]|uniref:hypothetical protein n=1 Tax=Methanimicrococcus hongohii TaxID=3028295 RepID=UPI00292E1511|nr:hypothetical protein [Methanimicrococcus sp. Hf6]